MSAFSTSAPYYELFAEQPGRLDREGPLLDAILEASPGRRVADIACGTGLHAAYLAARGATVDALDLSPDMVAFARERHQLPGLTFRTGDMRDLAGGPWDLAICLGNSLALIAPPGDLARTFAAVARCLAPGGLFLLQVVNYALPAHAEPRQRIERNTLDGGMVTAVKSLVPADGRTFLSLSFFHNLPDGVRHFAETAVITHRTPDELLAAAASAGLAFASLWGGYDRSAFNPASSGDIVMVMQKN